MLFRPELGGGEPVSASITPGRCQRGHTDVRAWWRLARGMRVVVLS